MSGGAVFDSSGAVVGVISRGWETDDQEGPSLAAWWLPVFFWRPKLSWPTGMYEQDAAVAAVSELPTVNVVGREHVTTTADGEIVLNKAVGPQPPGCRALRLPCRPTRSRPTSRSRSAAEATVCKCGSTRSHGDWCARRAPGWGAGTPYTRPAGHRRCTSPPGRRASRPPVRGRWRAGPGTSGNAPFGPSMPRDGGDAVQCGDRRFHALPGGQLRRGRALDERLRIVGDVDGLPALSRRVFAAASNGLRSRVSTSSPAPVFEPFAEHPQQFGFDLPLRCLGVPR